MKLLFIIALIPLFIPTISNAIWNTTTRYNLSSGQTYHNQQLHLYENRHVDGLQLTGDSLLTINGGSLLSNSVINNKSRVHLYIIGDVALGYPVIRSTQFNDHSTLIMETDSISLGPLFIAKGAKLNITHIDKHSTRPFFNSPNISGNVAIENLILAGSASIGPTGTLGNKYEAYDEHDYQQQPGPTVVTTIENLAMRPGSRLSLYGYIPQMQFNLLQINTLSGSGEFILSSHLAGKLSDKIVVREHATGHFGLTITDSGYEPTTPQRVDVLSVNNGDAHFDLLNNHGIVEAGVWQYTLQQEKNQGHSDWYLTNKEQSRLVVDSDAHLQSQAASLDNASQVTEPQETLTASHSRPSVMSRSAQAVINMASASRHILKTEMSTVRQRRGDMGHHEGTLSLWTRYLLDNNQLSGHHGPATHTHLKGIQIGIDNRIELNAGHMLLGTFISDSQTAVTSGKLSNGQIKSMGGSLYATWLHDSSFYWDNLLKVNYFRHEILTEMNNGQITKGRYRQQGLSIASEVGYSIPLMQTLTLTPYGKVSYFRTGKVNHTQSNGLASTLPPATSVEGEAGLLLETSFHFGNQILRPYLKAARASEWGGDKHVIMNRTEFTLPVTGNRGLYGLGSTLQITDNISAWAEMDYQKGKKIERPVSASLGGRISF